MDLFLDISINLNSHQRILKVYNFKIGNAYIVQLELD